MALKKLIRDGVLIPLPNAQQKRVVDAFADAYNYSAKLPDGSDNPQNKVAFAAQKIRDYINEIVKASEFKKLREAVQPPTDVDDDSEGAASKG